VTDPVPPPEAEVKAAQESTAEQDGVQQPAPESELETLRRRLEEAERDRDQYLALVKRTQADFENYQKRALRESAEERRYAHQSLARELLPILDNLDRATQAAQQAGETGPLVQGVAMVKSQFVEVLRRHGVAPMNAQGQPFDPHRHQAVQQRPTRELPPFTVAQVFEEGWTIHERVLRPASVAVAVAPPEPEPAPAMNNQEPSTP